MKQYISHIATAAALLGGAAGVSYLSGGSEPAPALPVATAAAPAPRAPAPRTPIRSRATLAAHRTARAVLDGVRGRGGLTEMRIERALTALRPRTGHLSSNDALRTAFTAYYRYQAQHPGQVRKPYLYFVDYGQGSRARRGYVFDMKALTIVEGPFTVAHGRGSDPQDRGIASRFSNAHGSNATALGLYLAQETYSFYGRTGGRGYSSVGLRLRGLSGRFNGFARERGVVVHGAPYVTASRAGRSEGCPAMEPSRARRLIPKIANGALVFLYSPRADEWLRTDRWVRDSDS
jgi:hypothetical protein